MKNKSTCLRRLLLPLVIFLLSSGAPLRAQLFHFTVVPGPVCVGQAVSVVGSSAAGPGQPLGLPGDSLYWNFGAAASIPRVRTSASITQYTVSYSSPGIYPFSVQLVRQGQGVVFSVGPITVLAGPVVQLGPDTTVCGPVAVRLAPRNALPAGSTLLWPDNSTGPSFVATAPGTYWLEVTNPSTGCRTRQPRTIKAGTDCGPNGSGGANLPAIGFIPNIVTANGDNANDYFVLDGLVAAEWHLQVFSRWGQEVFRQAQYDNKWPTQSSAAGIYYYLLRHTPSGQLRRGWVEVVK